MSPLLRSFHRRGRWASKNGSDQSGGVKSQRSDLSSGKKSTPSEMGSDHSVPLAKSSNLDFSSDRNKKSRQVSVGNRMITRASACPTLCSITPLSSRTIHRSVQNFEVSKNTKCNGNQIKAEEKVDKPENLEQRVLRPRGSARVNLSQLWGRKPFVDVKLLNGDSESILRRRIKVWWPLDSRWYYGYVKEYDSLRNSYLVVYDDGDEEWLDLASEHCKLQLRPGQLLDLPRPHGGKRHTSAALGSCKNKQLRAEGDQRKNPDGDQLNVPYDDQTNIGNASGMIKNLLQAIEHAGEDSRELSEFMNQGRVGNESISGRDVEMNGNCTSSSQSSCKTTCVYARRCSSKSEKVHGLHPISGEQPIDHSALKNREMNLATRFCNLLAKRGCSMQELESENVNQDKDLSHFEGFRDLVGHGSLNFISSSKGCSELLSDDNDEAPAPAKSDVIVPHSGVCDYATKQVTGQDAHFSNLDTQIFVKPSNQTGSVVKDVGSSGLVMSRQKNGRPNKTLASAALMAAKKNFSFQRYKGIQVSSSKCRGRYPKYPELPGRYIGLGRSFLQSFHFGVPEHLTTVLEFFGQQLKFVESNLCEDVLKRSFINRVSAQTLIVKQSMPSQLIFDTILCGDTSYSLLLKVPSLQFNNFFMTLKDGTLQLVMKAVCKDLHVLDIDTKGDDAIFCRKSDWHLSLISGNPCLVMQRNSLYGHAKGIDCNQVRSAAAVARNNDNLQAEFNKRSTFRPLKVVYGGSECLADMLEFLRQTFKLLIVFDAATASEYSKGISQEDSLTSTRPHSPVLMENGHHLGAVISSKNPHTRDLVVTKSRIMETKVPNFGVSEPLKPLLEKIWQFLVGKDGFHLTLSQILSLSMVWNAACMSSTSSPFLRIHRDREVVNIGSSLKYVMECKNLSSNLDVQPIGRSNLFHVKKRRRSDKALKRGILPLITDPEEIISAADGSVDGQARSKGVKRRKFDREWSNETSADIDEICRISHMDERAHEPSKSSLGEKGYVINSRCQSNSVKVWRASSNNEFSAWFTCNVSDEEKLNESKQAKVCMEFGSSKRVPSSGLLNADGKSDDQARDLASSFYFQPSKHGVYTSFPNSSVRTFLDASNIGIHQENVQNFNSRGKRPVHKLEFGAVDDLSHDRRKCHKTGSSFTFESELDVSGETFGRSDMFFQNSPGNKGDCFSDNMQYQDYEAESFSCTANILFVQHDRSWRELGARVELLLDGSTWVLSICRHRESLFTYKAEHSVASGSSNKYTHAMMWKGGKDWSLEFERRQWSVFKEMHHICFLRNTRAALVRQIPIPGVSHVQESSVEDLFVQPEHYIFQKQGELEAVLSCSRGIYDMDSEDEEWLAQANEGSTITGTGSVLNLKDDTLEALIEKLERTAYVNHQDMFTVDAALELCQDLGQPDVIKAVHAYWVAKRLRKGMPLVRYFQPAPWQRYQKQLQEWETKVKIIQQGSHLTHKMPSSAFPQRPPWFAFCLRPRGLEVPNKFQKQRSQKKLGFVGTARHWASAISLSFTTDDLIESPVDQRHADEHPEELFFGSKKANSQAIPKDSDSGFLDASDAQTVLGGKVRPGNVVDGKFLSNNTGLKLLRKSFGSRGQNWIGKRAGRKPKKKRIDAVDEDYIPKGRGKSQKQLHLLQNLGRNSFQGTPVSAAMGTPLSPLSRFPLERADLVALNSDPTSIVPYYHLESVAEAKAAFARKAADVAARKRAEAQALYAVADTAMRKAVSAVIAAEAIEAEKGATMASISQD